MLLTFAFSRSAIHFLLCACVCRHALPFKSQKGSNHEIEVKADLYTDSIRKKKPSTVPTDTIYVMVKEGAAWKILFYLRASERLADELLSQLTREERQDFLRKNRDRLDRDLVQSLVNRLGQPGRDDPRRILDIAMETANALGDPNAKGSRRWRADFTNPCITIQAVR